MLFDYNVRYQSLSDIDPTWPIGSSFPEHLQGVENLRRVYGPRRDALVSDVRMWSLRFSSSEARDGFIEELRRSTCSANGCFEDSSYIDGWRRCYINLPESRFHGIFPSFARKQSVVVSCSNDDSALVMAIDEAAWSTVAVSKKRAVARWASSVLISALLLFMFLSAVYLVVNGNDEITRFFYPYESSQITDFIIYTWVSFLLIGMWVSVKLWGFRLHGDLAGGRVFRRVSPLEQIFGPIWGDIGYLRDTWEKRAGKKRRLNDMVIRAAINRFNARHSKVVVESGELGLGQRVEVVAVEDVWGVSGSDVCTNNEMVARHTAVRELGLKNPLWWNQEDLSVYRTGERSAGRHILRRFYPESYASQGTIRFIYAKGTTLLIPPQFDGDAGSPEQCLRITQLAIGTPESIKPRESEYYVQGFHRVPKGEGATKEEWFRGPSTGVMVFVDDKNRVYLEAVTSEVPKAELMTVYETRLAIGTSFFYPAILMIFLYLSLRILSVVGLSGGYRLGIDVLLVGFLLYFLWKTLRRSVRVWRRLLWHLRNDGLYTYPDLLQAEEAVKRASAALVARGWREVPQEEWGMVRQEVREEAKARMQRQAAERLARAQLLIAEQGEYRG